MKLQTYRKETNKFAFKECKIWDFQRGYYNDGNNLCEKYAQLTAI